MKEGTRVCKINYIVLLQELITLVIGIGAVVGAMMMWNDPSGKTWGGDSVFQKLHSIKYRITCYKWFHTTNSYIPVIQKIFFCTMGRSY